MATKGMEAKKTPQHYRLATGQKVTGQALKRGGGVKRAEGGAFENRRGRAGGKVC